MKLTDFELEVMEVFWSENRELCANEIFEVIVRDRDVVYNTVKTIIDRLEDKGAIARTGEKVGRYLLFKPMISRADAGGNRMPELLERFFSGRPSELFSHLLDEKKISKKELKRIKQLLDEHE